MPVYDTNDVQFSHICITVAIMKLQLTSVVLAVTVFFGAVVAVPTPNPCGYGGGGRSVGGKPVEDCTG